MSRDCDSIQWHYPHILQQKILKYSILDVKQDMHA